MGVAKLNSKSYPITSEIGQACSKILKHEKETWMLKVFKSVYYSSDQILPNYSSIASNYNSKIRVISCVQISIIRSDVKVDLGLQIVAFFSVDLM